MAKSETEETKPEAKKKGRSKLLIIGIPMFVLLMGGGAGAWWYFNQSAHAAEAKGADEEKAAEPKATAALLPLDSFIVNLADIGGRKYLRVTMVLQVPSEAAVKEVEEQKITMSRLRSSIIEVLTTHTSVQLATPEGRVELKAAIAETAKQIAHLEVTDVLLEEFIIQ